MAQVCQLCGKGPQFGNNISHAHNVTRRRWNPNLQAVKAKINGAIKRVRVCTSCIKTARSSKAKQKPTHISAKRRGPAVYGGASSFLLLSTFSQKPATRC